MGVSHQVADAEAVLRAEGAVSPHQVAAGLKAVLARLPPGGRVVLDLRRVESVEATSDEIRHLSLRRPVVTQHGKPFRFAIVAPTDDLYGLSRMYQTLTSDLFFEVGVFRGMNEAKAWLARPHRCEGGATA